MICENCGEHYVGIMNVRNTARFIEIVKRTEATIKNALNENKI